MADNVKMPEHQILEVVLRHEPTTNPVVDIIGGIILLTLLVGGGFIIWWAAEEDNRVRRKRIDKMEKIIDQEDYFQWLVKQRMKKAS